MARASLPSQNDILNLLDYDPETGALAWRTRPVSMFKDGNTSAAANCRGWNKRWAGKPAFTADHNGYLAGNIAGKVVAAHRVIWRLMTGDIPDVVDHINGNRSDNRWVNLRNGTQADNASNLPKRKNNSTGVTGVFWVAEARRWRCRVTKDRKPHNLGYFGCLGHAIKAHRDALTEMGFAEEHGRISVSKRRGERDITATRAA